MSRISSMQQGKAAESPQFLRRMIRWPDDKLLEVVTHDRARYSPYALNAAEAELTLRGVSFNQPPVVTPSSAWGKVRAKIGANDPFSAVYVALHFVYLFYVIWKHWDLYGSWLMKPLTWLGYGLLGALLCFFIVPTLFRGAEYCLQKVRPLP